MPESSSMGRGVPGAEDVGMRPRVVTEGLLDRRAAVAELGAALRALTEAAVRTEVPAEVLRSAARDVEALTETLSDRLRDLSRPASVDDLMSGVRMYNPVIGDGNPIAPPMRFEVHGTQVEGRCTLGAAHEGPHMFSHGGMSALWLDQILGHAAAAVGNIGVTTNLSVRYRRPVPLGVPLRIWAKATEVNGNRTVAQAAIATEAEPEVALVEAEARFLKLSLEQVQRMYPGLVTPAAKNPDAAHD